MIPRPFRVTYLQTAAHGQIDVTVRFADAADLNADIDKGFHALAATTMLRHRGRSDDSVVRVLPWREEGSVCHWRLEATNTDRSILAKIANIVHMANLDENAVEELVLRSDFDGVDTHVLSWPNALRSDLPFEIVNEVEGPRLTIIVEFCDPTTVAQRAPFLDAWKTYALLAEAGAYFDPHHLPGEAFAVADYGAPCNTLEIMMIFERYKFELSYLMDLLNIFATLHFSTARIERVLLS